jgi:hypothetical protein
MKVLKVSRSSIVVVISLAFVVLLVGMTTNVSRAAQGAPHAARLAVEQLESRIYALGTSRYPNSFAGVQITRAGKLLVYLVPDHDRGLVTVLRADASKIALTQYSVVAVRHTWLQLNKISNEITSTSKSLRAPRIRLSYWGPDVGMNKVSITLVSYTPAQARELIARYGSDWIYVQHTHETIKVVGGLGTTSISPNVSLQDTRFSDENPYFGGDGYWFDHSTPPSQGYDCTSGFAVSDGSTTAVLASGHCRIGSSALGSSVYTNQNQHLNMGIVAAQLYPSSGLDAMEIVPTSGSGNAMI